MTLKSEKPISLDGISVFKSLTQVEQDSILPYFKVVEFKTNDVILEQGKMSNNLYVIQTGKFKVTITLPGNIKKEVTTLHENDVFGEITLLSEMLVTATITANKDSSCLVMSRKQLEMFRLLDREMAHKIETNIAKISAIRIQHNEKRITELLSIVCKNQQLEKAVIQKSKIKFVRQTATLSDLELDRIATLNIFNELPQHAMETILHKMDVFLYPAGSLIDNHDINNYHWGTVYSGAIQHAIVHQNDFLHPIEIIGPGDTYGYLNVFRDPILASETEILAKEDLTVLTMPYNQLEALLQIDQEIWYDLVSYLYKCVTTYLYIINRQLVRIECEFGDVLKT